MRGRDVGLLFRLNHTISVLLLATHCAPLIKKFSLEQLQYRISPETVWFRSSESEKVDELNKR